MNYDLNFQSSDQHHEYRFFTVHSYEWMEPPIKQVSKDEYDYAAQFGGTIVLDNEETENSYLLDLGDLLIDNSRSIYDFENEFCNRMEQEKKTRELIDKHTQLVQWQIYWYRRKEQPRAGYMADLILESSSGF